MLRFLKPDCKEYEAAEHLLYTWLIPWVKRLQGLIDHDDKDNVVHRIRKTHTGMIIIIFIFLKNIHLLFISFILVT